MIYDDEWTQETSMRRLEAIRKTIHPVTMDELLKLGEERFPVATDPWCEHYHKFLKEHPREHYYMARFFQEDSEEYVEVIYCQEMKRGMWFLPGKGMGLLQPDALEALGKIAGELEKI